MSQRIVDEIEVWPELPNTVEIEEDEELEELARNSKVDLGSISHLSFDSLKITDVTIQLTCNITAN